MNNNSTYLNILISKFNDTVDEIEKKRKRKEELDDFLKDNIVSLGNKARLERDLLEYEIIKLNTRRDTLKEIITEMKEYELCQNN